ncbi:MAG TPA: acetyltransferase [Stellaceae bacterium]|nr:acetyltransferase [Stellaceae bacterium]
MLPLIVVGGGGHGRVVLEALRSAGREVRGVVDRDPTVATLLPKGVPWLGDDAALAGFPPAQYALVNGLGGIGDGKRRALFEKLRDQGYVFAPIHHESAVISHGVELGEGAQVMAGAVLQPGVRLGVNAVVNTRAAIDHDCHIGDHCHVAPGAVLCGDVIVGEDTHIGAGAVVIQGVRIGSGSIIGAGAIIRRDVGDNLVVYTGGERRERPLTTR